MVEVRYPSFTCTQHRGSNDEVTIDVSYVAIFSPIERFLANHGLVFEEQIEVYGDDWGRGFDQILTQFPTQPLLVIDGCEPLKIHRNRSLTVGRQVLREDNGWSNDELVVRITLIAVGWPSPRVTVTTRELSLLRD